MLFRLGGSSPGASFGTPKAPSRLPGTTRGEESGGVGLLLREAGAETVTAAIACALLLIVWGGSGFPIPPPPWGNLVVGMTAVGFGCLMLALLYRQKRNFAMLRCNEQQLGAQKAL